MVRLILLILAVGATLPCNAQLFGERIIINDDVNNQRTLVSGDIDNDGKEDLLVSDSSLLVWYKNEGNGNFGTPNEVNSGYGQCFSIALADLDGDGDLDIYYVAFDIGLFIWYENLDGQGTFSGDNLIDTINDASRLAVADIDSDGDLDLLGSVNLSQVFWYENLDGNGTFSDRNFITNNTNGRSFEGGDIDGDGDTDIVVSSTAPTNVVWMENLDGQGNNWIQHVVSNVDTNVEDVILADVDGDMDLDILAAKNAEGKIELYKNDGGGGYTTATTIANGLFGVRSIKAADLENDGDLDVLAAAVESNIFAWVQNNGNGNFSNSEIIDQGDGIHYRDIVAADFDNDGDLDVAGIIQNTKQLVWYKNNLILSVDALDITQISLSPNPFSEHLTINSPMPIDSIQLNDLQGRLLLEKVKNTKTLNLGFLPPGVYFATLKIGVLSVVKKVVKN